MKVLIHDHPQLTYFARIYKETYKEHPQYFLLDGPSWMQNLTVEMHKYIQATNLMSQLNGEFFYITHRDKSFRPFKTPHDVRSLIDSHHSSSKIYKLIENSCVDTLCRNLDNDTKSLTYFMANKDERNRMLTIKSFQFLELTALYLAIIENINPDRIYISHGVYNCYVSLYVASILSGIDIRIHHGGYATRYYTTTIPSNLTPRYVLSNMYNNMVPSSLMLTHKNHPPSEFSSISLLGKDHKNSFVPLLLTTVNYTQTNYNNRVLIVTMPIFSEVNRMFDDFTSQSIFDNKWDYIKTANPTLLSFK